MHVLAALVAAYVFSAAVGAMAAPTPEQTRGFYGWLFRFLQILAANFETLMRARFGELAPPPPGISIAASAERPIITYPDL